MPQNTNNLPQDTQAERAVLGAIFLDNQALAEVITYITPKDFFDIRNRYIYEGMLELNDNNQSLDIVTLVDYINSHFRFNKQYKENLYQYISHLARLVPTAANIKSYARIIKNKSILRQTMRLSKKLYFDSYKQPKDISAMLTNAESHLLDVAQNQQSTGFHKSPNLLMDSFLRLDKLSQNDTKVTGLPTGYSTIDNVTTGLHPGEFIIIAARPAMGKTTLAVNIAKNVALKSGSVGIFSVEMNSLSLMNRMICAEGDINANHLRTGNLNPNEWQNYIVTLSKLSKTHLYIDDTPGINISVLAARAKRLSREDKNLKLIIVDYLQLVSGNIKNDRQQEVSEVSRRLKELAKELNVPVIALSQLSRSVEQREDKRPVLSDIRESGSIEQDADIVSFLYRKDYYERDKDDKSKQNKADDGVSDTEFIIEKNRSGPRSTIHLMFLKQYNEFATVIQNQPTPPKIGNDSNF